MVVHAPYPVGETRVEREALAALDAGFAVDVVAMALPGEPPFEISDGIAVHRLPFLRRSRSGPASLVVEYVGFTLLAALKVAALHRRRRIDTVHVHNPPDFLLAAAIVPRLAGARIIFDIHDFAPELFSMRFVGRRGSKAVGRLLEAIEGAAIRYADAILTVHEPYRRQLLERGVDADKIEVALNTIDDRLLPPHSTDQRLDRSFRIVYHGTLTWHYGVDLLLEAFAEVKAQVPSATLEVYGAGDALESLRKQSKALRLEDVHLEGRFVPQKEVLEQIVGASAGIVYNRLVDRNRAAVPTKLFEYAALRIPAVVADLPAVHEYFSEEEIAFVEPQNPSALARTLIEMAGNPAVASARADAAFARFDSSYRWSRYAEAYVGLLMRLTRDGRRRRLPASAAQG
jgi:glycosyltransferase involved in cell wall biosynthesis